MFAMDQTKVQGDSPPSPDELAAGVIISPDARRANRLPPGQSRTRKWPILDASGAPGVDRNAWKLSVSGLVARPHSWNWNSFRQLPRVQVFSDFHCVTRWSRLGNLWEGVAVSELMARCGGLLPEAKFALVRGYDSGWSTNLPVSDLMSEDALVATSHDGETLSVEHGGPARLIIPRLYAWKSAKWIAEIELIDSDRPGFWERNGYHMHGNPWKEERHGW